MTGVSSSISPLTPLERAQFAVLSRLISCLVTEGLLRAFYIPIDFDDTSAYRASGSLVVLSTGAISEDPKRHRALGPTDVLAIIPLHHPPVFRVEASHEHGRSVGLVDPLDMLPEVYELVETTTHSPENDALQKAILSSLAPPPWELGTFTTLSKTLDPIALWNKFVDGMVIESGLRDTIQKELSSSLYWQKLSYDAPPQCPTLTSPPIVWEQSLVEGHPTHPMHRARTLPFDISIDYDWYHPQILFVRVPRDSLDILGTFESDIRRLAAHAAERAGKSLPVDEDNSYVLMPVHELQLSTILAKFKNVEILDPEIRVQALAQSSIRTVVVPDMPGHALKLAVNVKISSSLRTISHFTADFGPRFSTDILPKLHFDHNILTVAAEPASAVYRGVTPDIAKHFTAVIRDEFEPVEGENVAVCAALLERGHEGAPAGIPLVQHVFGLDTDEKRVAFLDRYIQVACDALIPTLMQDGVGFEAHAQNVLLRFSSTTGEILGFIVRDLGGLRIHPPTLAKSTGADFAFLPNHCIVTKSIEDVYRKFYHTLVHNHFQRLIRVLGLHYDGRGWDILRTHLNRLVPVDHPLWKEWMGPESGLVLGKCLMRMKIQDLYRDVVYSPFPNMVQFRPTLE